MGGGGGTEQGDSAGVAAPPCVGAGLSERPPQPLIEPPPIESSTPTEPSTPTTCLPPPPAEGSGESGQSPLFKLLFTSGGSGLLADPGATNDDETAADTGTPPTTPPTSPLPVDQAQAPEPELDPSAGATVTVFDWDDTLLATTVLTRQVSNADMQPVVSLLLYDFICSTASMSTQRLGYQHGLTIASFSSRQLSFKYYVRRGSTVTTSWSSLMQVINGWSTVGKLRW